jgi:hypothetical protein
VLWKKGLKVQALIIAVIAIVAVTLGVFAYRQYALAPTTPAHASILSTEVPPVQAPTGTPRVVVVYGSNYEMGYQYGFQAADLIYHNLALFKSRLLQAYGEETLYKDMKVWAYYLEKYDPYLKDWLMGIRAGCQEKGFDVSYLDLVALTCYPAEMWCRPNIPYPEEVGMGGYVTTSAQKTIPEGYHSCTAVAAAGSATKDGKPVVAITKMVPREVMQTLILIAFPKDGYAFIANPYAGAVVQNSGMNSEGFAWVLTAILGPPIWGVVTEVYFHYLTQYCASPAQAIEYLKSTPRAGVTGTFVMSDAEGNLCVFESNSQVYAVRTPGVAGEKRTFLVQTNHFIHPELQAYNIIVPKIAWKDSLYRYATAWEYMSAAAEKGIIDFDFIKNMFQSDDWYDPDAKTWHYNDPGSENVLNNFPSSVAQSIFFPADRIAYFQVGTPSGVGLPAGATGEYVKLQLTSDAFTLTTQADEIAFSLYSEARNIFQKMLNSKPPYLTDLIVHSIKQMLDEAMLEYECGMDRAAFAYLARHEGWRTLDELQLWSDALTHYAKAQLYAQMAISRMKNLSH